MKKIIEKYKNLKKRTADIKKYKETYNLVETENLEREFPIEIIASTFENRLLTDYELIEDFWCFITNEEVTLSNIYRFISLIEQEVVIQHPNLKILNYDSNNLSLDDSELIDIIDWYQKNNGETIKIKSLKKGYTKTLTNK